MKLMRFNNLVKFVKNNEIISTDKFLDFCSLENEALYWKRDFLFKSGIWRGNKINSYISSHKEIGSSTLVVGHSDIYTGWFASSYLRLLGLDRIFGTNLHPIENFAFPIPLGVTNKTNESKFHPILGDNQLLLKANSIQELPSDFSHSIYLNINANNNIKARSEMIDALKLHKGVINEAPNYSENGRIKYLSNLRKHNFTPCPVGNGVDTHRLWETIYMGGTPVIKSHPALNSLIRELPVIVLKSWYEILDAKKMEKKWNSLNEQNYNFEKLSMSYWETIIAKSN